MDAKVQLHAWVQGHVQGVGFRYFVRQRAAALQLSGWVRNLHDGRVEFLAEGERSDLEALLSEVKAGPTGSQVSDVKTSWGEKSGDLDRFEVRPTA